MHPDEKDGESGGDEDEPDEAEQRPQDGVGRLHGLRIVGAHADGAGSGAVGKGEEEQTPNTQCGTPNPEGAAGGARRFRNGMGVVHTTIG
jgi:hypothetical protein